MMGLLAYFLGKEGSMMQYCFLYSSEHYWPYTCNVSDGNR